MTSRSDLGRAIQIGKESVIGEAATVNRRFGSLNIDLNFEGTTREFRPQGNKFFTNSILERSLQKGTYEGPITFSEIIYPLSSLYGTPTPTTPSGGTLSREWAFLPPSTGQNTVQSYTLEEGDADAAVQSPGMAFSSIALNFTTQDLTMRGSVIAPVGTATTLTSSGVTQLAQVPAQSNQVDMYMATSYTNNAALFASGNKITDPYDASFDTGDTLEPNIVLNSDYPNYKDLVEKPSNLQFSMTMQHNVQSRTLFTAAQSNAFRYLGVRVLGPTIEGSIKNSIHLVVACSVTPQKRTTTGGGIWGFTYKATPVFDSTLGSAFKVNVVNAVTAL